MEEFIPGFPAQRSTVNGKGAPLAKSRSSLPEQLGAQELSREGSLEHYSRMRRSRRRHAAVRVVLVTLLVAMVALGTTAWAYVSNINAQLNKGVNKTLSSVLSDHEAGDPFYMLLLGIDKDESRAGGSEYGSSDNAYRSDSIMLVRIDPQNKKVTLVSIHRDTQVKLGSNGTQKINAAYSIGGAAYATQVISDFAGVPISHYAEVDMDGLAAVVDQVGGVTVDLPVDVKDPDYTGLDLKAGQNTLDGRTAALLCRARHAYDVYGDGDRYRAANQRIVISAVVQKVLASNPLTLASTVSTLAGYVTTDMDVSSIASLSTQFLGMDVNSDIMSGMEPTTPEYVNDTWYEICDTAAWKKMMDRVNRGLSPYEDGDQDLASDASARIGDNSSNASSTAATTQGGSTGERNASTSSDVEPSYSGDVLVLNGTHTDGLAGKTADKLDGAGFGASSGNAGASVQTTTITYTTGHEAEAAGVARTLGLKVTYKESNDSQYDGYDVVVTLGVDYE